MTLFKCKHRWGPMIYNPQFEEKKKNQTYCFSPPPHIDTWLRFCYNCRILEQFKSENGENIHEKVGKLSKKELSNIIDNLLERRWTKMGTSKQEIKEWFKRGVEEEATHMLVVCDTYDWEDYPVYVKKGQDPHKVFEAHSGKNMQSVMEVYNLSMDMEKQLREHRAFNY